MFLPRPSAKQRQFCCVFYQTENGDLKMDRRDQELLDKQMRRLTPPRNEGAIAVMLAAMFLVGMALGGVLSPHQTPHQSAPTLIASLE
jgi:hypothetical protein